MAFAHPWTPSVHTIPAKTSHVCRLSQRRLFCAVRMSLGMPGDGLDEPAEMFFESPVQRGMARDEFLDLEGSAESAAEGAEGADGAFPADMCDLTGVCDPAIKATSGDRKIVAEEREARVVNVRGGGQLYDYGRSRESVLRDDSIKA